MTKFESIDARVLLADFSVNQIDAMLHIFDMFVNHLKDCVQSDCMSDEDIWSYAVTSVLSRADFTMSCLNVVTDPSYQDNDLVLSSTDMILLINDLVFALESHLDVVLDVALELDEEGQDLWMSAYHDGVKSLRKLKSLI